MTVSIVERTKFVKFKTDAPNAFVDQIAKVCPRRESAAATAKPTATTAPCCTTTATSAKGFDSTTTENAAVSTNVEVANGFKELERDRA